MLTTTGQSDRTAIRLVHPLIPAGKGSRGTGVFSAVHKVKGQKPSGQTLISVPEGNLELCFSVYCTTLNTSTQMWPAQRYGEGAYSAEELWVICYLLWKNLTVNNRGYGVTLIHFQGFFLPSTHLKSWWSCIRKKLLSFSEKISGYIRSLTGLLTIFIVKTNIQTKKTWKNV